MKKISLILIALFLMGCGANKCVVKTSPIVVEVISCESTQIWYEVWYDHLQIDFLDLEYYSEKQIHDFPERLLYIAEKEEKYPDYDKALIRYRELEHRKYIYNLEINKMTERSKSEKVEVK